MHSSLIRKWFLMTEKTMSISEQVHESVDEPVSKSSTSLPSALTEHHNSTPYEGPFTLKTTTTSTYISHSDAEGLSSDEVGQLLASDRTPWGIDWMEFSFPVSRVLSETPFPWCELQSNGAKWTHIWKTTFEIGQGTVDLSVTKRGNALGGYLKFNPSTCMYGPKSLYISRLDDALYVADVVLDAVNSWVVPGCERQAMLLSRIDVSVTVEPVADVQRTLAIVKNTKIRGTTPKTEYGKDGRIETITRRSKRAGGYCVYDKGLQTGLNKSAIRFEVTARRARLRDVCSHLGDLNDECLKHIAIKSLGPVIENLRLQPRTAISDILAGKKESTPFIEMVGLATLADLGHYPSVTTYALNKKYRPILKKYSARTVGDLLRGSDN